MRNEQIAQTHFALQLHQQIEHLALDGHIQRAHRFIANQKARLQRQRARDANPLPLATGKLKRIPPRRRFRQAHLRQQIRHPLLPLRARAHLVNHKRFLHNRPHRVPRIEALVRILKNHLNLATEGFQLAARQIRQFIPFKRNTATRGFVQTRDRFAERALPTTTFAHEPQRFARHNRKAHAIHRLARRHRTLKHPAFHGKVHPQIIRR